MLYSISEIVSNWLINYQAYILCAILAGAVCYFKAPGILNIFLRLTYLTAIACLFVYMGYIVFNIKTETWQLLGISLFIAIGSLPLFWIIFAMFEKDEPEGGKTFVIDNNTKFNEIPDGVYKDVNGTTRIKFGDSDERKQ